MPFSVSFGSAASSKGVLSAPTSAALAGCTGASTSSPSSSDRQRSVDAGRQVPRAAAGKRQTRTSKLEAALDPALDPQELAADDPAPEDRGAPKVVARRRKSATAPPAAPLAKAAAEEASVPEVVERRRRSAAELSAEQEAAKVVARVPLKASRRPLESTDWGRSQPLPFLLRGTIGSSLQGVVKELRRDGAVVQLLWEVVGDVTMPLRQRPGPQPSPLLGVLDLQALGAAFGRHAVATAVKEEAKDARPIQLFVKEGQRVNVQVRFKASGTADPLLPLELVPEQPSEPVKRPRQVGQPADAKNLSRFLERRSCRLSGLGNATDAVPWPALPAASWQDPSWQPAFRAVSPKLQDRVAPDLVDLLFTAWAVADSGRDLVVTAPLTLEERALLYFLPMWRHLQAQPRAVIGSPPSALVLASRESQGVIKKTLIDGGLSLDNSGGPRQVIVGSPSEILAEARSDSGLLSRISFVAVDLFTQRSERFPLGQLLNLMPGHRWGPTVAWSRDLSPFVASILPALVEAPSLLQAGDALFETQVRFEIHDSAKVTERVTQFLHKYPRLRVLVFADDHMAMAAALSKVDVRDRLSAPVQDGKRVAVMSNSKGWLNLDVFDVVIQASAPPDRREYTNRLGACRQLAVNLMATEGSAEEPRLTAPWRGFVRYARFTAFREVDQRLLRRLAAAEKPPKPKQEEPPRLIEGLLLRRPDAFNPEKWDRDMAQRFKVGKDNILEWSEGIQSEENEVEMEFVT